VSELGDDFRTFREYQKKRKRQDYLKAKPEQCLAEAGIGFTTHNEGLHLIVENNEKPIDFWPTTGRWISRNGKEGFGVKSLIEYIERGRGKHENKV
jgi:hypothetical protein